MANYTQRVRKLDSNGDISLSGDAWLYDIDAVAQTIKTRLNLFSKEYWRDVSEGTPWIKSIWGKNNSANTLAQKERLLKERIINSDGVISIVEWSSDFSYSDRKLSVSATVLSEFGLIKIENGLASNNDDLNEALDGILGIQLAVHNWIVSSINFTNTVV
jgi:hypothetical protein